MQATLPSSEPSRPVAARGRAAAAPTVPAATGYVALVAVVTVFQVASVAMFAVMALSGDGLGIVRAMALVLAGPLLLVTLPAILLLRRGYVRSAALLAGSSTVLSILLWRFA